MSALHDEVAPFGIHTTAVNPGFFRTDLISDRSTSYAAASIDDYDGRREEQQHWWQSQAGKQPGNPAKLAAALVRLAEEDPPPRGMTGVLTASGSSTEPQRPQSDRGVADAGRLRPLPHTGRASRVA
jgi:NAD(P)-dependent dehydrogenase (short-subunit alcohol dehydrogenase family)